MEILLIVDSTLEQKDGALLGQVTFNLVHF